MAASIDRGAVFSIYRIACLPIRFACLALLAGGPSAGGPVVATAQEPTGLQAAIVIEQQLVKAIERSEKSVVSIARIRPDETAARNFRPEPFPRPGMRFVEPQPRVGPDNPDFVPNDFASGVVFDAAGLIVTNLHAVEGPGELWVTTSAKRPMKASVVGADPRSDLAVLRVDQVPPDVKFEPIAFGDGSKLRKGQIVIALGNPYAIARDGEASASWGIVSNLSRKAPPNDDATDPRDRKDKLQHFGTLIQTDAKLNLGTSGGALLNLQGEMVGLTTSQAAVKGFESAAGYAIPVDETFRRVLDALKVGKQPEYGLLGVSTFPLSAHEKAAGRQGVYIETVRNGSPAERAGLAPRDLIRRVAGQTIDDVDALMLHIGRRPAGSPTDITIERDGRVMQVHVALAKYEVRGKGIVTAPQPSWRGIQVDYPSAHQELDPQFIHGLRVGMASVLVTDVEQNGSAWDAGLRRGMLVTHVNNVPIENPAEFYQQTTGLRGTVELRLGSLPGQPPVVRIEE